MPLGLEIILAVMGCSLAETGPTDEEFAKTHAGWTCILNIKYLHHTILDHRYLWRLESLYLWTFPHGDYLVFDRTGLKELPLKHSATCVKQNYS